MNPDTQQPATPPTPEQPLTPAPQPAAVPEAPAFGATPNPFGQASAEPSAFPAGPAPAPAPIGSAPGVAPSPAPKSSNGKKIALIGGIAGGVILLAIIGIVAFLFLTTVSKQDYKAAADQYNATAAASTSLNTKASLLSLGLSRSTDAEFTEDVTAMETAITTLEDENNKLGELKAVRVGEGKEIYDTFDKKLTDYLQYAKDLVSSVKTLRPALATCSKVSDATDVNARVAALNACSTGLNGVGPIANAEFKTYVDAIKENYATFATTYESISKLTNPYGSQYEQYKVLRDKMYDVQDNISTASKTFTSALNKRDDEVSVKDSATALGKFLTEKQQ